MSPASGTRPRHAAANTRTGGASRICPATARNPTPGAHTASRARCCRAYRFASLVRGRGWSSDPRNVGERPLSLWERAGVRAFSVTPLPRGGRGDASERSDLSEPSDWPDECVLNTASLTYNFCEGLADVLDPGPACGQHDPHAFDRRRSKGEQRPSRRPLGAAPMAYVLWTRFLATTHAIRSGPTTTDSCSRRVTAACCCTACST